MKMTKRLTREQKRVKAVEDILNKMFEVAGHKVTFDDIKDRKDNWYQQYTMTETQYEEWKLWGKLYLIKNLKLYSKQAENEMSWICMQWGLKTV